MKTKHLGAESMGWKTPRTKTQPYASWGLGESNCSSETLFLELFPRHSKNLLCVPPTRIDKLKNIWGLSEDEGEMRFSREQNHKDARSFCRQGKRARLSCRSTLQPHIPSRCEVPILMISVKPSDGMRPLQSPSVQSQDQRHGNLMVSSKETF